MPMASQVDIAKVLIDTWWNVNLYENLQTHTQMFRFNRYMVECELDRFKLKRYCKLGFNRYMVECE